MSLGKRLFNLTVLSGICFSGASATVYSPVISANFPDPVILATPDVAYARGAYSGNINIQVATSYDNGHCWKVWMRFQTLHLCHTILQNLPRKRLTALDLRFQQTLRDPTHNRHDPLLARQREVVPSTQLGSKMPMANVILFTKSTGAALVEEVPVETRMKNTPRQLRWCQMMEEDALPPTGDPVQILDRGPQDGPLVEAPVLFLHNGFYALTYSSNCYSTDLYDIAYAAAPSVSGPYTNASSILLMTRDDDPTGPG
ncbi:hypothetical protein PISMIDRAFT_14990 [Pisolithus microcarpus 441]|uniref:Uncharacterized protein n=1 Tax=Pisolithus microcarpus 441 TaxID=765257 RepID=A0A0C9Z535_9AGAM|nr:glycoside hydrolase family 43 protein [Pisolithus microcarpus]KIK17542.1 hypothetical protein PISMIDRAFT_14990 [Pisolithus microcarpus 441]